MDRPSIEVLAERLERLERQCRRWRWTGIALALAMAVAAGAYAARRNEVQSEIRARSVWIVDERGRSLIRLGSSVQEEGNGLITFLDKAGTSRMVMGITGTHAAVVSLIGRDGRDQLVLDASDDKTMGSLCRLSRMYLAKNL